MKRLLFALLLACGVMSAQAVSNARAKAQEAYRAWRLVDPNLEADAANNPATLSMRAERVAAEAAKYFAARQEYLDALKDELEHAAGPSEVSASALGLPDAAATSGQLALASSSIANNLAAISNSTDAGLRDLRRALERERTALTAIAPAVKDTNTQQNAASDAARAAATAQSQLAAHYRELAAGLARESEASQKIGAAWADYYRSLATAASTPAVSAAPPKPVEPTQVVVASVPARRTLPPAPAANADQIPVLPAALAPSAAVRSTAPGAAPASRYTGEWIYPTVGEHYHGARPESVELTVREESGQLGGSFHAKFRLQAGSKLDPIVEFTFNGPYQSTRTQTFPFTLDDGTKGTLELIPATTFNLLEINFSIDERPGKINKGNFFIIRK